MITTLDRLGGSPVNMLARPRSCGAGAVPCFLDSFRTSRWLSGEPRMIYRPRL